ncbi:tRNA pseudouridine(38-40) synthase TruA [Pseudodesulfovibrio sp. F-1]|uniref:tRNA pseudouridine synthase A n=1 Tax=Pseudodesulfovibrio alkaliphilus TaxID=2661613 RepID=A0A7K1KKH8_9BACT|nr:tRNA pseudouridine(38-40) synthase TruA [Pseudodesulfovibrio alkaliphilus]MUM76586.1 tRNA pseudouridine(38-40) synthase TruA [Pseudodesulfovibrio alkaliphilus]
MPRFLLTLAYDGTDFSGWQLQPRERTVQGEIEASLARLVGIPVRVHGSGRTDAGVHALGQTAHFDCPAERAAIPWQRALNATLPQDVRVLRCDRVAADFHARYHAQAKTYEYGLWHQDRFCLPQRRRFVWDCGPLDFAAMDEVARLLAGTHDFAAFQNTGTPVKSTVRTLADISRHPGPTASETIWRFTADGFLKQMVRNLMGCLVACGRDRITPADAARILASADRAQAPATAPARGLTLIGAAYPARTSATGGETA